jgi:hypothetical protein
MINDENPASLLLLCHELEKTAMTFEFILYDKLRHADWRPLTWNPHGYLRQIMGLTVAPLFFAAGSDDYLRQIVRPTVARSFSTCSPRGLRKNTEPAAPG